MRILATIAATLAVLAAIGLAVIYSGLYDVAASSPHSAAGRWLFRTTMERSVQVRAKDLEAPPMTQDHINEGVGHYVAMCEGCHGAPGVEPNDLGRGLTPSPPDLAETASAWRDRELFWIIKHGLKMTGMPAWGEADSDEALWTIVAFVKSLPDTSAAQYQELKTRYGGEHRHEGDARGGTGHDSDHHH